MFTAKRRQAAAAGAVPVRCYAQAELRQEVELAYVTAWTPQAIDERQRRLATWAVERWPVPLDVSTAEPDVEDDDIEPEGTDGGPARR